MGGVTGATLPAGDVTFLLTDIEGSTALLARLGGERFGALLSAHHALVRTAVERRRGVLFKSDGDGLLIAFADAGDALSAALDAQESLAAHEWPADERPRVRMVLHSGEALVDADDYVSMALHRAARLLAVPHGGQTICSGDVLARVDEAGLEVRSHLLGAYWLRDFPDAVRLHQLERPASPLQGFPALQAPRADLTNLHGHGVTLIGRDALTADIDDALAGSRLVTLAGPGGVGKTSLAVAAAERLVHAGTSAWLVEFAPVERLPGDTEAAVEQRLVAAIGRALGMAVEARPTVLARLATRAVTLVLDNCEHVVDAAAAVVAEILAACPQARVLATSREQLGLPAERVVAVAPFDVPTASAPLDELAAAPAVAVFVARARQANPGFALTAANAADVVAVCRELDGIPLALELAGGATRHLSPADLARRLREVGTLPLRASRRPVARHRSLAAVLDWSLASLDPQQVVLFRRLGAFAGPAGADAVAAVCGDGTRSTWEVLDDLAVLVDKNLVVLRTEGGTSRFDLLVTMRRAARQLLDEAGEGASASRAHATWVVQRVRALFDATGAQLQEAEPELVPECLALLERWESLGLVLDDVVAVLTGAPLRIGIRAPEVALRITRELLDRDDLTASQRSHVYAVRVRIWGHDVDAGVMDEAIAAARAADDPRDLVIALVAAMQGLSGQIDVHARQDALHPHVAEIVEVNRRVGSTRIDAVVQNALGAEYARTGDLAASRAAYLAARSGFGRDQDTFNTAVAEFNVAEVDELAGADEAALRGYARAAETFRLGDYHLQHAVAELAAAGLCERMQDYAAAADHVADAVLAARRSASRGLLVQALGNSARIAARLDDTSLARASAGEILELGPDGPQADVARAVLGRVPDASPA